MYTSITETTENNSQIYNELVRIRLTKQTQAADFSGWYSKRMSLKVYSVRFKISDEN